MIPQKGKFGKGKSSKFSLNLEILSFFIATQNKSLPSQRRGKGEQMVTWRLGRIAMPSPNTFRSAMECWNTSPMSTEEVDKAAGLASTAGVYYTKGNVG